MMRTATAAITAAATTTIRINGPVSWRSARPAATRWRHAHRLAAAYTPIAQYLSEQSGRVITREMVHAVAKDRFLEPLIVEFDGKVKRYPGSTTRLGKKAFNEYIEKVFAWGADELGVFFDSEVA